MNKSKEEKSHYEIELKPEWLIKLIEKLNKKND